MKRVAIIPARGESKRVPNKNIRILGDKPLIAYTIASARNSGLFDGVYVSTEHEKTAFLAGYYGAEILPRPERFATDVSPDREFLAHAIEKLHLAVDPKNEMWILRPTNPFRGISHIVEAVTIFYSEEWDSLRSVSRPREHPEKMWHMNFKDGQIVRYIEKRTDEGLPTCDFPTQTLDPVYIQNGAIQAFSMLTWEIYGNQTGVRVKGYEMVGRAGWDINYKHDWEEIQHALKSGEVDMGVLHGAIAV